MIVKIFTDENDVALANRIEDTLDELYEQGYTCEVQYDSSFCVTNITHWIQHSAMVIATPLRLQNDK